MAVENVLSNFSPIISVGYSVFDIDGIDNEKISEDVLARKDLKFCLLYTSDAADE